MRVLAIAFSIKPGGGSEPAVGWTWTNEIAKVAEHVTVLVRDAEGQREAIEEYIRKFPMPNVSFLYYELPGPLKNIVKGDVHTRQTGMRRYYIVWQIFSLIFLKKHINIKEIDIVHHVTFENDWLPSFYTLLGVRHVVLGPLGSNSLFPCALHYPPKIMIKNYAENIFKVFMRWINPLFRYNMMRADAIIGISPKIHRRIGTKRLAYKFYHLPGVSVSDELQPHQLYFPKSVQDGKELILFTASTFTHIKNIDLSIKAFFEYKKKNPKTKLVIAGDGYLKNELVKLIARLHLANSVEFLGWISMQKVYSILKERAHIFLFPTLECGGTASIEAMRCGVPVVCIEGYGYSYFIKDSKGSIAVPIRDRHQVVKDMAEAVDKIARNLSEYSLHAFEESKAFLPERKRELLEKIYTSLMEKDSDGQ